MFLYSSWLNTSLATRHKIANEFGIQKKGSTHVIDNQVQNDGYLVKDIEETLTTKVLQEFVGTEEKEPATLWNMFIQKFEAPVSVPLEILHKPEPTINTVMEKLEELGKAIDEHPVEKTEVKKRKYVRKEKKSE
jgi:hypothetical protein